MASVDWTPRAIADVRAISSQIAFDSPRAADLFVARVFQATERLELFPLSGRVVPEGADNQIREIIHGNYRIIYRLVSEDAVDILTVHHAARLLP